MNRKNYPGVELDAGVKQKGDMCFKYHGPMTWLENGVISEMHIFYPLSFVTKGKTSAVEEQET